ncbi:hypothetical protein O181_006109 [Austropuccinia psidii MF-1]|uniref:Uncharacterized protein n=1 Tax=Austropuccinia psidii MF-1 TaxID=1389203 RepID=A0A9Q3BIR1_9BASI|nr:hypothetical protein [Austropuccinia psidii MF-1]
MSSDSFCACSKSIDSERNDSVELMTSNSPTTPNIPLKPPIAYSMIVSGIHIEQDVPVLPPRIINVPGITVSSITNPTGIQSGNEYPPYQRDYLLNSRSTPSSNQVSGSHSGPDKKPMLTIPPNTEKRGIDQFQRSSEGLNCRGNQSSSGQRDNPESSAPQPGKHGSSSSRHPLHDLADAFVQDYNHREQQEQQTKGPKAAIKEGNIAVSQRKNAQFLGRLPPLKYVDEGEIPKRLSNQVFSIEWLSRLSRENLEALEILDIPIISTTGDAFQ